MKSFQQRITFLLLPRLSRKSDPMANTYTQIHIHAIFAVTSRACLIDPSWKKELYLYISGIIANKRHRLLAINGMPDHLHLFFGMRPNQSLSDLMQDIKGSSSLWINQKKFVSSRFSWQEGYGAFSHGLSAMNTVIHYIHNQEIHHHKKDLIQEYRTLLSKSGIMYEDRFIFHPVL